MIARFLFAAFMIANLAGAAGAQTVTAPPSFDAATVKAFAPSGPWQHSPQVDPQRLYIEGMTPLDLILYAYDANENQIVGLPAWARQDLFQVEGVTSKPVSEDKLRLMLQHLLADQFDLAFAETDSVQPVYALMVAPGGPKMTPWSSDANCAAGISAYAGQMVKTLPKPLASLFATCTVAALVKSLNSRASVDLPVVDKTGLAGAYAIVVWQEGCQVRPCSSADSFQDAVRRELGLDLVRDRAPYRLLRVARIERPDASR